MGRPENLFELQDVVNPLDSLVAVGTRIWKSVTVTLLVSTEQQVGSTPVPVIQ